MGAAPVVAHIIVVALATRYFDDPAEQQHAVVAVFPPAARLESQAAIAVERHIITEFL